METEATDDSARDALYVVCSEKPHSLIDAGRDHFETIRFPAA